jgi:hypothetical protein
MSEPPGQVTTKLPSSGDGGAPAAISAGREVEQGARSMLILAPGLFRLDVVPHDDTVQAIVRNLSPEPRAELRFGTVGGEAVVLGADGEALAPATGRFGGEVVLVAADGSERTVARLLVGSVCDLDRGLTSFTAQATLH